MSVCVCVWLCWFECACERHVGIFIIKWMRFENYAFRCVCMSIWIYVYVEYTFTSCYPFDGYPSGIQFPFWSDVNFISLKCLASFLPTAYTAPHVLTFCIRFPFLTVKQFTNRICAVVRTYKFTVKKICRLIFIQNLFHVDNNDYIVRPQCERNSRVNRTFSVTIDTKLYENDCSTLCKNRFSTKINRYYKHFYWTLMKSFGFAHV